MPWPARSSRMAVRLRPVRFANSISVIPRRSISRARACRSYSTDMFIGSLLPWPHCPTLGCQFLIQEEKSERKQKVYSVLYTSLPRGESPMPIPPHVKDFASLIRWLADTYHGGHVYPISKRAGVSSAITDRWRHGVIRQPRLETVRKVCDAYNLSFSAVIRLLASAAFIMGAMGGVPAPAAANPWGGGVTTLPLIGGRRRWVA